MMRWRMESGEISAIADAVDEADTLPGLLASAVRRFQHGIAVRTRADETVTDRSYGQLKNDADALSARLAESGIVRENVALIGSLTYEWIVAFFGVTGSHNTVVTIDKDMNPADMEKLVLQADVSVLLIDGSRLDAARYLRQHCGSLRKIVCLQAADDFPGLFDFIQGDDRRRGKETAGMETEPGETAMIVFTAGADGSSKAVMLTHRNLCHNVISSAYLLGPDVLIPGERTVPVLPPHHMFAVTSGVLCTMLFYGITCCIAGGLSDYLKSIRQFRPAVLMMVPMIVEGIYKRIWREARKNGQEEQLRAAIQMSERLLKQGIDQRRVLFREVLDSLGGELRLVISGGARLDPDLVDKFRVFGITLLNGYGITECSPIVSCNRPGSIEPHSVGKAGPQPYCQVRIQHGEIQVRGTIVTRGYYQDEAATRAAFEGEWFKTGDMGYLDENGYLYLTGRKKDLIILKDGNNISPVEIEQSIEQHPLANQALVYAETKNLTEILVAVIHPDYRYAANNEISDLSSALAELIDTLNRSSPPYKRIRKIELREDAFDKERLKQEKRPGA